MLASILTRMTGEWEEDLRGDSILDFGFAILDLWNRYAMLV